MSIEQSVSTSTEVDPSIRARAESNETSRSLIRPGLFSKIGRGVSRPGGAVVIAAVAAIVAGVLAAIAAGADDLISLLVGYCSVTTMLAALGLSSLSCSQLADTAVPSKPAPAKTSDAWKLVSTLTIADASRLWCDVEPGATTTQETIAWGRALIDAVKRGELPIMTRPEAGDEMVEQERANPHYMTQVSRDALKSWASRHGHSPNFLQGG